jgi:hypothetical protein
MNLFGSVKPELDIKLHGKPFFTATANEVSTHYFSMDFNCYMNGVQFYAWDSNKGDNVIMEMQYNAGELGWKRYKKFVKTWNIFPDDKSTNILFPKAALEGTRIMIKYDNKGMSDVDFAINLFTYSALTQVNIATGEEGEDW